jgi:molecular chaperone IbpA
MRNYDFSPLFRHSVGFDHIQRVFDNVLDHGQAPVNNYPPYNIEAIGEDAYRISIAIAGFSETDLEIVTKENTLSIKGNITPKEEKTYLHQGVAGRTFERSFGLADYVKVVDAHLENGLLDIDLIREIPEAQKPHKVEIKRGSTLSLAEKTKKLINREKKAAA